VRALKACAAGFATQEQLKVGEDGMAKIFAWLRLIAGALALVVVVAMAAPVSAQQVNPNASSVKEQQLLDQLKVIHGRGTIPDVKSYVLEHPAGRDWREFRTVTLKWIGGIAILGMLALLVIFYLWRGTIHIEGGRSGRTIVRFSAFERFVHWLTATSFVILGLTGLNVSYGRSLILPWMGLGTFSTFSEWAKFIHNYLSFAFTIGVVLMFLMWIGQNFPTAADVEWLKMGGGMGKNSKKHAPAHKFNAGQKLLYWFIVLGGAGMIISGYMLMFPFYYGLNVGNMELAEVFHGVVGVLFIALIVAHIYLGTLGMEGAFESMSEGTVDLNWAKEHHNLWVEEEMQGGASGRMRPAE
jgi:formate dehydrogenase subunit gamma